MQDISSKGIELLCQLEGFSPHPYRDIVGNWTIGFGTRITDQEAQEYINGITKELAQGLLFKYIQSIRQLLAHVESLNTLLIYQTDALFCLIYNIGLSAFLGSTILKHIINRNPDITPWSWWDEAGHSVIAGLSQRRQKEMTLFVYGLY